MRILLIWTPRCHAHDSRSPLLGSMVILAPSIFASMFSGDTIATACPLISLAPNDHKTLIVAIGVRGFAFSLPHPPRESRCARNAQLPLQATEGLQPYANTASPLDGRIQAEAVSPGCRHPTSPQGGSVELPRVDGHLTLGRRITDGDGGTRSTAK